MRTFCRILLLLSACLTMCVRAQDAPATSSSSSSSAASETHEPKTTKVVMHTALGDIELKIEVERAPITAKNFLRYVDQKRLDGMVFYRAVKVESAWRVEDVEYTPNGQWSEHMPLPRSTRGRRPWRQSAGKRLKQHC